jgi:phage gpG-like protein
MRMKGHAQHTSVLMLHLAQQLYDAQEELYDTEGGPVGGWTPLKDSTVEAKAAAGLDSRILHATLALRDALTGTTEHSLIRVDGGEVRIGTDLPYFRFHATGTSKMPKRQPAILDDVMRRNVMKGVQRWITTGKLDHRRLR